jgi:hypothetical protein
LCEHNELVETHYKYRCGTCGALGSCSRRKALFKCALCLRQYLCKHGVEGRRCEPCAGSPNCEPKPLNVTKQINENNDGPIQEKIKKNAPDEAEPIPTKRKAPVKLDKDEDVPDLVEKRSKYQRVCEHEDLIEAIYKFNCRDCGEVGGTVCAHRKQIYKCVACSRSYLCQHRIEGRKCVPCGGTSTCEHKRLRQKCVECGGINV